MLRKTLALLLVMTAIVGLQFAPAYASETASTISIEGGELVDLIDERYPSATKVAAGQTVTYTQADFAAANGDMLLFSMDVRCESVCSAFTIEVDCADKDTSMRYYAPIQWSRVYMPVVCAGSVNSVKITVENGAVLIGATGLENKKSATFEDLKLQSGMWMLDDFLDVPLDADYGVRNENQDVYTELGVSSSACTDLVISSCGNYVYSIGGGALTVTDVSDPSKPRVRSIYTNPDYDTKFGVSRQIALLPNAGENGDAVMFTGRISGAFIVDVSNPDQPVELCHYDAQEMATGIAYYEGYAFIANRQYGVEVVDVSDPRNPVHVGVVARGGEVQSCRVVDGILYCGIYNENTVELYDVTDVVNAEPLGVAHLDGHGDDMAVATIDGKTYLFASTGHHSALNISNAPLDNLNYGNGNGLDIFDVTDPNNPVLLSVSKNDGRFWFSKCDYWGAEVAVKDGRIYVYLLNTYNGVHIYDATNLAAPVRLAHVTLRVDKESPYYSNSNLNHTTTVNDPIFNYDPNEYKQAPVGAMTVYEGALYLAGVYTDLHIYETELAHTLFKDEDPTPVSPDTPYFDDANVAVRPGGQTVAIANYKDLMYVAAGNQGILIYSKDLKTLQKTIPVSDICYDLYIQDGLLYAAEGRSGAAVYTISSDGLTLTETKRYVSSVDLVTTIRPSATGRFIALSVGATTGEIVDVSATPKRVVRCSTSTQAYHHYVEVTANGQLAVFWGLSGYEVWYDFGPNDSYDTPKKLFSTNVRSKAAMQGGYTAYKDNVVIMTRSNGYVYYDPTTMTGAQIEDLAVNHLIRPVTGYGSTTKTSIYGRGFVHKNLLITCDRVYGKMYITDISVIDKPVLLKSWTGLKGTPDIATVVDNTLYVPMGYEGIMMVDLSQFLESHTHCECANNAKGLGDHTACEAEQWAPISEAFAAVGLTAQTADFSKLPSGNYYLDTDVVVTATEGIGTIKNNLALTPLTTRNIKLCINGHDITTTQTSVFRYIRSGSELTITDCTGKGTIYGGTANYGQMLYGYAGSTVNIFGGNFTSNGTAKMGGVLAMSCDYAGDRDGDGDCDDTDKTHKDVKSTLNIYGGRIYGGKAEKGGNIGLLHNANMNMYGGIITKGTATKSNGGNISSNGYAAISIHGGEISEGYSTTYGGNIHTTSNSAGRIYLYGGTIRDGESKTYCANVYNGVKMYMYGGTISGGTAGSYAGSVQSTRNFYMYGGTITGGEAKGGAGGNLMIGSGSSGYIYGGTIEKGTASTYGGNVHVLGTAKIYGGTITQGNAKNGGNICTYENGNLSSLTSADAKGPLLVQSGTATSGQGSNLYIYGTSEKKPTVSLALGTFQQGDVYAGPYGKVTLSGSTVISQLVRDSEAKPSIAFDLSEDGSVTFSKETAGDTFGTGSAKNIHSDIGLVVEVDGESLKWSSFVKDEALRFSAASVTLQHNLGINFKIDTAVLEDFESPYVKFSFGGAESTQDEYVIVDGKYIYRFRDIAPHRLGDTITATVYAYKDGVLCQGATVTYSVKQYCYNMLETYNDVDYPAYGKLRTLLVDLLNYGAAAQTYTKYSTGALVNGELVDKQLAWGTATDPAVSNAVAREEQDGEDPTVTWDAVGLTLDEAVTVRLGFIAESTEDLSVKFTLNGQVYEVTEFKDMDTPNGHYVYFSGLNAAQLRNEITAAVYQNGRQVSNTVHYSAEAYVANHAADENALGSLVKALIRYGDAAEAYVK